MSKGLEIRAEGIQPDYFRGMPVQPTQCTGDAPSTSNADNLAHVLRQEVDNDVEEGMRPRDFRMVVATPPTRPTRSLLVSRLGRIHVAWQQAVSARPSVHGVALTRRRKRPGDRAQHPRIANTQEIRDGRGGPQGAGGRWGRSHKTFVELLGHLGHAAPGILILHERAAVPSEPSPQVWVSQEPDDALRERIEVRARA